MSEKGIKNWQVGGDGQDVGNREIKERNKVEIGRICEGLLNGRTRKERKRLRDTKR